jgi:hypothetical protein
MPRAQDLIAQAYLRLIAEVPPLDRLKVVLRLELRGRGDVQVFRVRIPGPEITKGEPEDARLDAAIVRSDFNELAANGGVKEWREAIETGRVRLSGDREMERLIATVIERHQGRGQRRRVR